MSNYWKKKLEELEKEKNKKTTSSATPSSNYWQNKMTELEKENEKKKNTDIAPVVSTTKEEDDEQRWYEGWFKKGNDNVAKTILGTVTDFAEDIGTGIIGMGEKIVDAGMTLGTYLSQNELQQAAQNEILHNTLTGKKTDGVLEKYQKVQGEVEESAIGFVEKDLYDEAEISKQILSNVTSAAYLSNITQSGGQITQADLNFANQMREDSRKYIDESMEADSVLANKTDSLVQSAGQMAATAGLQSVGVPWWLTTGATSFGSESENALRNGATIGEATISATVTALGETLTEKLTGGISFGSKTFVPDELLARHLGRTISNKVVRTLIKLGVDATGEGFEEVAANAISAIGQRLTYDEEKDISAKELLFGEEAIESFIGGFALGSTSSGRKAISTPKGTDFATGLKDNEKKVVDLEYEKRIAEEEKDGKKLTNSQKAKIYDQVIEHMDKGYISIATIEEALGGDTYTSYKGINDNVNALQNEYDTLKKGYDTLDTMKWEQGDLKGQLKQRVDALEQQLNEAKNNPERARIGEQLATEVFNVAKDSRLAESYREFDRSRQPFQADVSKYKGKAREIIQRVIDSGVVDNTRQMHEYWDWLANIGEDSNINIIPTTTAEILEMELKLHGAEYVKEVWAGKRPNAYRMPDGTIAINMESREGRRFLVGHEITHSLEKAKHYGNLRDLLYSYAETKMGKEAFEARKKAVAKKYNGITEDADSELTADLVGEYLYAADEDFVKHLSAQNKNVFQKVWDEIKHLYKMATAGSQEARELERIEHLFAKVYREANKTQSGKATDGVKHSVSVDAETDSIYLDVVNRGDTEIAKQMVREAAKANGYDTPLLHHGTGNFGFTTFRDGNIYATVDYGVAMGYNGNKGLGRIRSASKGYVQNDGTAETAIENAKNVLGETYTKLTDNTKVDILEKSNQIFKDINQKINDLDVGSKEYGDFWNYVREKYGEDKALEYENAYQGLAYMTGDITAEEVLENSQWFRSDIEKYPARRQVLRELYIEERNKIKDTPIAPMFGYLTGYEFGDALIALDFGLNRLVDSGEKLVTENGALMYLDDVIGAIEDAKDVGVYALYGNVGTKPLVIDEGNVFWSAIPFEGEFHSTDYIVKWAKEHGYTSVLFKSVLDPSAGGSANRYADEYVFFDSNQVKSADPVTYDDNGNVIPLSERFNAEKNDILHSVSMEDEAPIPYGRNDGALSDGRYIAPTQEVAPVKEVAPQTVEDNTIPDGFAPMTEEQAEEIREDSFASLEDADAPPEKNRTYDNLADSITIDSKSLKQLSKNIGDSLGLNRVARAELERVMQEFSQDGYATKENLYAEIENRFGTQYDEMRNDEVARAKEYVRNTKVFVSPDVKGEFGGAKDYTAFMRSNFGKIRFSNEGLGVDEVYAEAMELYPDLFPNDIDNVADQLRRIAEVANTPATELIPTKLPEDTLLDVTDTIYGSIAEYRETARLLGNEEMKELAESHIADFAPIGVNAIGTQVGVATEDAAPTYEGANGQMEMYEGATETKTKKSRRQELHESILENIKSKFTEKGFDFDKVLKKAKNLSTFATVDNTPQRVMEKSLGYKEGQILSDLTVNQVAQNETEGIKWLNSFTDKQNGLLAKISKQYNIKPGSKESAAAQMYAEGFYVDENNDIVKYGDAELATDFPNAKVRSNIKGLANDSRIRQIYDDTLAMINESRTRNAYPEIPRLDNYFLHFRAMEDTFSRLGLPFNPNDIRAKDLPTDLNGVTADLKPGQPYFASAMHRTGKRTSFDLLGGLEKYLTSAKNQIYHIDDIQTLRALRNYIADTYGQANGLEGIDALTEEEAQERIEQVYNSHLSTFAKFLNEEANVIAGKTALIDRGLEGIIGRRGITFLNAINKQVGSNMVGMNISSSLTNFLPVVQTMAKSNKADFIKGFSQTVASKIGSMFGRTNDFAENSPVMIRRKGADQFNRTPYQKIADTGYILMGAVDSISTEIIARTKYNELTRKGMDSQKAHFETDKWVSRLMGDRSLGQQPQIYNSKMLGLFTKFQLEVRNQLDAQFYDTVQEAKVSNEDIKNGLARNAKTAAKVASTFLQLAIAQHAFGKVFESIAGYNPAFDIISVLMTALGFDDDEESEDTALDNIGQGFLELLEDLPYTSTLTGGRIPISSALPIQEVITGKDQYGNEKSRLETLGEAAPYYVLPTGYGQIKKTQQGLSMFDDDLPISGSYTDSGNLRFPVEDTLENRIQAGVFGQWASDNARDYFDNDWAPLKEKQVEEFVDLDIPIKDYREIRADLAKLDTLGEKAVYISDLDLPIDKKNLLINNIADREEPIDLTDMVEYGDFGEFDYAQKYPDKYSFLTENGVSYDEYQNFDEDAKEAWSWAYQNPEKFTLSKAVTSDLLTYKRYTKDLGKIKADKDEEGKSISGSRKEKVLEYINNMDADYGEKLILFKSEYNADDTYNMEIINYLNSREDLSYEDMETILKELGFTVSSNGYISW